MADIVFLPDLEEGHVFPTFKLARRLEKIGYSVCYVGIRDVMQKVARQGFTCHVILEEDYPAGYANSKTWDLKPSHAYFLSDKISALIDALKPKLFIASCFLPLGTLLLHYRFNVPHLLYHCMLPPIQAADRSLAAMVKQDCVLQIMELNGSLPKQLMNLVNERKIAFKSFTDLVAPLDTIPKLLLCPEELDVKKSDPRDKAVQAGPCVRESVIGEEEVRAKYLPKDSSKKIILGSAGSQTREYPDRAEKFFKLLIGCMQLLPEYHLILSIGKNMAVGALGEIPANVQVVEWVPQVELLPHTSLAITHGGLGSIKECVYYGVPMLVIPMGRDQKDNAERVRTHHLGMAEDLERTSVKALVDLINHILSSERIKSGVAHMQSIFHERENNEADVAFIMNYVGPPEPAGVAERAAAR